MLLWLLLASLSVRICEAMHFVPPVGFEIAKQFYTLEGCLSTRRLLRLLKLLRNFKTYGGHKVHAGQMLRFAKRSNAVYRNRFAKKNMFFETPTDLRSNSLRIAALLLLRTESEANTVRSKRSAEGNF